MTDPMPVEVLEGKRDADARGDLGIRPCIVEASVSQPLPSLAARRIHVARVLRKRENSAS